MNLFEDHPTIKDEEERPYGWYDTFEDYLRAVEELEEENERNPWRYDYEI